MGFSKIAKIGLGAATGGASLLGKDLLLGKKDMGEAGRFLGLDASLQEVTEKARGGQAKAATMFSGELGKIGAIDSEQLANREMARRMRAADQLGADLKRNMAAQVAQRGLGKSAVGLSAIQRADENALRGKADIVADLPSLKSQYTQQKLGQIGAASGGLNQILQAQGAQRSYLAGRQGMGRSGGLLGVGMAAGGAYMAHQGGRDPGQGAQAGMGLGRMTANL